eukprot:TRINITY_DN3362_c1_g1_i1.p1 TRINITY_DN3362_c1_g1~~TRINITY_DN3362_c1_g1_i1.p1  ORF type:complete len:104 (-),score=1.64 TRINITY_DN3362_c1_g1_i1:659-970(-)
MVGKEKHTQQYPKAPPDVLPHTPSSAQWPSFPEGSAGSHSTVRGCKSGKRQCTACGPWNHSQLILPAFFGRRALVGIRLAKQPTGNPKNQANAQGVHIQPLVR